MDGESIERRGEGCYPAASRVSLDSAVYEFLRGESRKAIVQDFPSLSLVRVDGAIAFYLASEAEIGEYL